MKKRLLGTLMTIAMLTTFLMGCSAGNTTSENSQAHGTENMKGKTEVDFWYSGGKTAVKVVQNIVDDYNKSQDKYFVKTVRRLIILKHMKITGCYCRKCCSGCCFD